MKERWGLENVWFLGRKSCVVLNGRTIEAIYDQPKELDPNVDWKDGCGYEINPAGIDIHVHDRWGQPEKEELPLPF